jgi:hypothetical protein
MKSLAKTGRRRRRPTLQNGTVPPLWRLDRIQDFPRSGVARGLGARKRRKLDPVARDEAQCSGVRPIKRGGAGQCRSEYPSCVCARASDDAQDRDRARPSVLGDLHPPAGVRLSTVATRLPGIRRETKLDEIETDPLAC